MKRSLSLALVPAVVALAVSLGPAPWVGDVSADTYTFKFAHAQPDTHPRHKSMIYFKEQVEAASKGQIKVELFAGGVLGKEPELMDMVKLGNIQGTRGALFERANRMYLLYTLPFLFANIEQAKKVIRSDFGEKVNQGAKANGFYVPATGVAGGFRQFTNNVRPIATPDDMKGLKMRTPPIDSIIRTMTAMGANPQQVPYGDTYMALKTNVVDGQENPCSNIAEMKFYEVQKYFTEVNYQIHPDPFFVSLTWYDALPSDLKAVFTSTARAAMARSDDVWLASEKDYQALLAQKLRPNKITAENHKAFVAKVKPVWDHYVSAGYFTRAEIDEALAQAAR